MDFTNKNINLLNIHSGLQQFSANIFDSFGVIFLLTIGLPLPIIALVWASNCIIRSLLRPIYLFFTQKVGLKKALIYGILFNSGLYLVLYKVNGLNNWLLFYIFYLAICDIAYWLPFHSYYAIAGDKDKRGKQIGVKLSAIAIFQITAPLLGGIVITHFGFLWIYILATLVMLMSIIPILLAEDKIPGEQMNFKTAIKTIDKRGFVMQVGDGILYLQSFVWTVLVYYLVKNFVIFGGLITLELFLTSTLFVLLGFSIDKGNGKKIGLIGLISLGIVIILRSILITTIFQVIVTNFLFAIGMAFYSSAFGVRFYNLSKNSGNTLWFHFFGELGWDIGAASVLIIGAVFLLIGVPLQYLLLCSLIGLPIVNVVFKKF